MFKFQRVATIYFKFIVIYSGNLGSKGIARITLDAGIPIIFGVLTTDTIEQAIERAGLKAGNKGYDAAVCAIEMANLLKQF